MKFLIFVLVGVAISEVHGHGYLKLPAARNSMWRYGYLNPKNYNDNELFCGGRIVMNRQNGGKCGVCGDPYHMKNQRHADGGRYANGIIAKTYKKGQQIDVEVFLTTSHKGHFEFRVGDFSNKKTTGDSIGKLQGELLTITQGLGKGGQKYPVIKLGRALYKMKLQLPKNLTCKRCVLQWWYRGGNNWGRWQEHFVNCADIAIE